MASATIFTEIAENIPIQSFYIYISIVQTLLGLPTISHRQTSIWGTNPWELKAILSDPLSKNSWFD